MPIAVEGGIDLAVLGLIAAIFCLIAAIYILNQFAPSFPIIGNVFADHIGNPLINWLIYAAYSIAGAVWDFNVRLSVQAWGESVGRGGDLFGAIQQVAAYVFIEMEGSISSHLQSVVNWAFGRDINQSINLVNFVASGAATDARNALGIASQLAPEVAGLLTDVANLKALVGGISAGEIGLLQTAVNAALARANLALGEITGITTTTIPLIDATISALNTQVQGDIANTIAFGADIAVLTGEIPGIRAGEQAAVAAVGAIEGRVGTLETDITKVLPLAAVTALGAIAVENIVNLAEDPCLCLGAEGDYAWVAAVAADVLLTQGP